MENLHEAIVREILYRLPVDSILECIHVCKSWRILACNTYFVKTHYLRQLRLLHEQQLEVNGLGHHNTQINVSVGQIFLTKKGINFKFQYVDENYDYETNNIIGHDRLQPFDHFYKKLLTTIGDSRVQDKNNDYFLCPFGSCNGLVCFYLMYQSSFKDVPFSLLTYPIFVCNPVTGEYVNLPRCGAKERDFHIGLRCGIGYDYSNNVYKVVCALHNTKELEFQPNRLQVYTLGDANGWRIIKIPSNLKGECIHVDGSFFWLADDGQNIVAFDLADEVFEVLPKPPFYKINQTYFYYKLHILRKCLCVVIEDYPALEIWLVKKKKKLQLNNSGFEESTDYRWNWVKELSMSREGLGTLYIKPVTVSKNGQILLLDLKKKALFLYDPKTTTAKEIVDDDVCKWEYVCALPHTNSLVSLKALGMSSNWIQ